MRNVFTNEQIRQVFPKIKPENDFLCEYRSDIFVIISLN